MNEQEQRAAFLQTISENPGSATNYLVFADWLDERGEDSPRLRRCAHDIRMMERAKGMVGRISPAPENANHGQIQRLYYILLEHPDAWVEKCADEKTGRRFGWAKKRHGRCEKIGSSTCKYQLWAVWNDTPVEA